jgi:hypothetical protein
VNTRGVSVTLNFALSLLIAGLLLSMVMMATKSLVDSQKDQTVRSELRVIGEKVASSLMTADRLAESGASSVTVFVDASNRAGSVGYEIRINATAAGSELILEPNREFSEVHIDFRNSTEIATDVVNGGDMEIVLTDAGRLEVNSV